MHVNWCMFCVFIDPGSYDVLFRLHLSAYFLHHVSNDRVTFYDMHSLVFNIEVPSSSHLLICNTRLLSFPATHFWYNHDRTESGRPGVTPSLFAGSVTCVGQHHYMPDIAIIPRDRFSRRPIVYPCTNYYFPFYPKHIKRENPGLYILLHVDFWKLHGNNDVTGNTLVQFFHFFSSR